MSCAYFRSKFSSNLSKFEYNNGHLYDVKLILVQNKKTNFFSNIFYFNINKLKTIQSFASNVYDIYYLLTYKHYFGEVDNRIFNFLVNVRKKVLPVV